MMKNLNFGKYIESVSIDEVVWCLLKGHHGAEVEKQKTEILKNKKKIIEKPDFSNWQENMIRKGALAQFAGAGCPLTSLLLRVRPSSKWNNPLKFSRYYIFEKDFFNLYEINNKMPISKAVKHKKYKNNKKINKIKEAIRKDEFDFKDFNRIVLCNIDSKWFIFDGTHRVMALAQLFLEENYALPALKFICFNEPLKTKRKFFVLSRGLCFK